MPREMEALSGLVGRWEGTGWIRHGSDEPRAFAGTEVVESRLAGRVLVVEGLHHAPGTEEIVHHALAVISVDQAHGGYHFRSHLATGQSGDYRARFEDGALVWGFEHPQGSVRFTIELDGERWTERGEHSRDGRTWAQFLEMDLRRVGP